MQVWRGEYMDVVKQVLHYLKSSLENSFFFNQEWLISKFMHSVTLIRCMYYNRKVLWWGTLWHLEDHLFFRKLRSKLQHLNLQQNTVQVNGSWTSELIWLKPFLHLLGMFHKQAMEIYCDNQASIHIVNNLLFHERMKHIENWL